MRTYTRRFLNREMEKHSQHAIEIENAVVWSIDSTNRYCEVKIQGSTEKIRAFYPENWARGPAWLQPGRPVHIRLHHGARSHLEIVGEGQVVPSPVEGENTFPDFVDPSNLVTTSCEVVQIPNSPEMKVLIKTGKYRINNSTYTLEPMRMESILYRMGMGGKMGEISGIATIAAAPSSIGNYRFDLLVAGTDSSAHVVKGTTFTTSSSIPDVPASHVEVGRVLVHYGMTEIIDIDINKSWNYQDSQNIVTTWTDNDLAWADFTSTITIAVLDQYNNPIAKAAPGWNISLEFQSGNGNIALSSVTAITSTSIISGYCGTSNELSFIYTRDQAATDESPTLQAKLEVNYPLQKNIFIILRNSSGEIMAS